LILLDIMMPSLDGLSAMMKIRASKNIPIILLSAKTEDSDKILGLSMGADDYIAKPYNPDELLARVQAQLRRYMTLGSLDTNRDSSITVGDLSYNKENLWINQDYGEKLMNYEVIKAVCETGNLSKAAKMLNYSQSAVSQTIQNYEKQLGITLFERSKTGVKPLPGVLPIIESVKKIADEEKKIKEFAESIRDLEQGVVRIGSLTRIVTKWLPDIFAQLERDYPNIRYQLETGSLYELQDYLENDKADFALMSSLAAKNYALTKKSRPKRFEL